MTVDSVTSTPIGANIELWLSRAAMLQFVSLALQTPTPEILAEMRDLCASLPSALAESARVVLEWPADAWEPEFFSVLGPAGCAVCESSYERAAQASRGPLLAKVAGFYEAFGYTSDRLKEVPDHAAVEFGFLSFLAMKVAFATFESKPEKASVATDAYADFHRQHIGAWFPDCVAAVQATGSEHYGVIGTWAGEALRLAGVSNAKSWPHRTIPKCTSIT